ncbi:MAG: mechanosensitive ion channel family protein [Blastocatellales bacterium]
MWRGGRLGSLLLSIAAAFCLSSAVCAQTLPLPVMPQATPAPAATPSGGEKKGTSAIPLEDVVDTAVDTERLLTEIVNRISQLPDPVDEEREIRARLRVLTTEARDAERLFLQPPNLSELWRLAQLWRSYAWDCAEERRRVDLRASRLSEEIRLLNQREGQWRATLAGTQETADLTEVFQRIRDSLSKIEMSRDRLLERQRKMITLQNLLSQQDDVISGIVGQIDAAKRKYEGSLVVRDSYPLWDSRAYTQKFQVLRFVFGGGLFHDLLSGFHMVRLSNYLIAVPLSLFIVSLGLVFRLRRSQSALGGEVDERADILKYPVSLSLPVLLLSVVVLSYYSLPLGIINVLMLVMVVPVLRITPHVIEPSFRPLLYVFLIVFLMDMVRRSFTASPVTERIILAAELLAAIVLFVWPALRLRAREFRTRSFALKLASPGVWLTIILLAISLVCDVVGYVALSEVILEGSLFSVFLAIVFLTGVRALDVIIPLLVHLPGADRLAVIRIYREPIKERAGAILSVLAFLIWLIATLEFFTIRDLVLERMMSALRTPLSIGALQISAWDVIFFLLVLGCGIIIARILRFILQEEFLERLPLRHGLPHAISTVVYYLVMFAVLMMSLAATGVELSKFTILTGALGVGIGIGLQGIVNNFLSGIIMLFERPIRINDVVEIEGLKGKVKDIGIRATIVETYQGAEVVVPNAEWTTNKFVNWTLSTDHRRVDLPVSVAYGSDIQRVLKVLEDSVRSHPLVLSEPSPSVVFIAFGDSGLLFELRFWLHIDDDYWTKTTQVADFVSRGLSEAGIEIPFPQMDLHLRDRKLPIEILRAEDEKS